jgi:hypothetical protein
MEFIKLKSIATDIKFEHTVDDICTLYFKVAGLSFQCLFSSRCQDLYSFRIEDKSAGKALTALATTAKAETTEEEQI